MPDACKRMQNLRQLWQRRRRTTSPLGTHAQNTKSAPPPQKKRRRNFGNTKIDFCVRLCKIVQNLNLWKESKARTMQEPKINTAGTKVYKVCFHKNTKHQENRERFTCICFMLIETEFKTKHSQMQRTEQKHQNSTPKTPTKESLRQNIGKSYITMGSILSRPTREKCKQTKRMDRLGEIIKNTGKTDSYHSASCYWNGFKTKHSQMQRMEEKHWNSTPKTETEEKNENKQKNGKCLVE